MLPVPASAATDEGEGSETGNGDRPNETASERETKGNGGDPARYTPARARSKSAAQPFGGLSPSEAGKRSAEKRRAKAAELAKAEERAAQDAAKDA